jgi:hypothetical protein
VKPVPVCLLLALVVAFPAAGRGDGDTPPPGATARCRDGTFSFSSHHSGTCSHHGGVSEWLDHAASTRTAAVTLGRSVLLGRRTLTGGCRLGPNPDRRCSPGAYYSGLTKPVLCSPSFRTTAIRNVPDSERFAVEREYGLTPGHYGRALEIDHIVSLELGGSNEIANLFAERANARPGYHVKDTLENRLHAMLCTGRIDLRAAQGGLASNWQALYERVYGTKP